MIPGAIYLPIGIVLNLLVIGLFEALRCLTVAKITTFDATVISFLVSVLLYNIILLFHETFYQLVLSQAYCEHLAIYNHYFSLAVFISYTFLGFELARISIQKELTANKERSFFLLAFLVSWVLPLVVVAALTGVNNSIPDSVRYGIREDGKLKCWINQGGVAVAFLATPIILTLFVIPVFIGIQVLGTILRTKDKKKKKGKGGNNKGRVKRNSVSKMAINLFAIVNQRKARKREALRLPIDITKNQQKVYVLIYLVGYLVLIMEAIGILVVTFTNTVTTHLIVTMQLLLSVLILAFALSTKNVRMTLKDIIKSKVPKKKRREGESSSGSSSSSRSSDNKDEVRPVSREQEPKMITEKGESQAGDSTMPQQKTAQGMLMQQEGLGDIESMQLREVGRKRQMQQDLMASLPGLVPPTPQLGGGGGQTPSRPSQLIGAQPLQITAQIEPQVLSVTPQVLPTGIQPQIQSLLPPIQFLPSTQSQVQLQYQPQAQTIRPQPQIQIIQPQIQSALPQSQSQTQIVPSSIELEPQTQTIQPQIQALQPQAETEPPPLPPAPPLPMAPAASAPPSKKAPKAPPAKYILEFPPITERPLTQNPFGIQMVEVSRDAGIVPSKDGKPIAKEVLTSDKRLRSSTSLTNLYM